VDFEEKHYTVGKIPGVHKREGRPPKRHAHLRLIDRPLRPLFAQGHAQRRAGVATVLVR
jgi:polyribonucleotide nucleotidyltransferase